MKKIILVATLFASAQAFAGAKVSSPFGGGLSADKSARPAISKSAKVSSPFGGGLSADKSARPAISKPAKVCTIFGGGLSNNCQR